MLEFLPSISKALPRHSNNNQEEAAEFEPDLIITQQKVQFVSFFRDVPFPVFPLSPPPELYHRLNAEWMKIIQHFNHFLSFSKLEETKDSLTIYKIIYL